MDSTWHYHDIIDLEYFFQQDQREGTTHSPEELHQRDRTLFLSAVAPHLTEQQQSDRRLLVKAWLQERRTQRDRSHQEPLPGQLFDETRHLFHILCFLFAMLLGTSLCLSFFTYTGNAPLNVFFYLATFVLVQLLLLGALALTATLRTVRRRLTHHSLLYRLLATAFDKLFHLAKRHLISSRSRRNETLGVISGLLKGKRVVYGSLFFWPFFIVGQLMGIGFNVGVLTTTLLHILGTDVAFGWQSTLQLSAEAIHSLVSGLSLPWAWLTGSGLAHPSLAEIEGSRIILKDGIYHLTTQNLVSWWPFLCLAVLVYGLLPRLLLLSSGLLIQRRLLHKLAFTTADCDRLIRRMVTPVVSTQAPVEQPDMQKSVVPEPAATAPARKAQQAGLFVLVADDIFAECDHEQLTHFLQPQGFFLEQKLRFDEDYESDMALIDSLAQVNWHETAGLMLLLEGWMPPISDFFVFLGKLRQAVGDQTLIRITLTGRPTATIFTPVDGADMTLWQGKITRLGDPYLSLETLP